MQSFGVPGKNQHLKYPWLKFLVHSYYQKSLYELVGKKVGHTFGADENA